MTTPEPSKIKLPLSKLVSPNFVAALRKLSSMKGLSAKDTYALARALKNLNDELDAYNRARDGAIKKFGAVKVPEGKTLDQIPEAERQYWVDQDSENWPKFEAEINDLGTREVELFLNHKILLPPNVEELTPFDVMELLDLVEA